ncbi:MAG: DNA topoisomerase (ATP-hydrolyzing) subunit B [Candidatus Nealsonbacteria bacterium CG_4_10_14_0_2_um_filter_40_15]|uniref:DNA topoisomerase (ATP-hydrolyzing) n=2 Tax=Candidatus Nealsoniibacteriota TaxID=1817911 RepID=A0A2M7UUC3_9BACT|nr:MAG: DNA topoisomerase (ATP-hydrolyzing) subunit B [Candidatus Nealsonbacteria bacterium CG_4_10_14_0_2_um_filter_40_15]
MVKKTKIKSEKPESDYTAKDILVLEGLEPVRKRPGMYIGSTGPEGLHHLVWECVDNSIDEAMAGYAKNIDVVLMSGNKVKTVDDGRGIPVEKHPQTKKSALETVMTTLHKGAKFGSKAYKISGGLHGVGVAVVCALSIWTRAEVCRQGQKFFQEYSKGKVKTKVTKFGACKQTGTTIIFEPDPEIFGEIKFDVKKILTHLRQQAYLTKGIKINFVDEREKPAQSHAFYFEGGLASYVKYLTQGVVKRHPNIFYGSGEKEGILVEAAFQYTDEYECYEEGFANNIHTGEGGTHLTGFRTAITRTFNDYAKKNGLLKEDEENLGGEDMREGFTGVVSVKLAEPQFEGQTKAKLGNPEVKPAVEAVVSEILADFLERNPQDARAIIEKCILSSKARKAAKVARETVLRRGILEGLALPGKLADCTTKKPEESEIYIVEGESAGGCFAGDTKVALADGRNLSFKELIKETEEGKRNYCYTIKSNGSIGIELIKNPRKTKSKADVIKVILDNKEEIICTPDHKFMVRDGSYKKAHNLTTEDSLMPLKRQLSRMGKRITIKGYELIYDPKEQRWIFTHLLADKYNLMHDSYSEEEGNTLHHVDFNKLNNNPENIIRMPKMDHFFYHTKFLEKTIHRADVKEKVRKIHQSKTYREKIKKIMTTPEMKKMLSERAKKQWEDEEYKKYMLRKSLEFYQRNKQYRERNRKLLYENQKKYWSNLKNREKWSGQIKEYFERHPEKRKELSVLAKKQWQDEELLKWRSQKTKEQWTPEFRIERKKTYNNTYREKALKLLREIFEEYGKIDKEKYNQERMDLRDRSLLRYETIRQRFFNNNEERLKEAILNYNHKIKKIIELKKKIDVYDLEVEDTHNFALASGVFVHNSGKQARNRQFQAILPLRGKILNVERTRLDKILVSKEIRSLIIALGTAIAEDFNLEKLRYHRIIIMTDADVDGSHIRTLLLTLFYRYFKPIIEAGYLYIAQPPLYRIQAGKQINYAYAEDEKNKILSKMGKSVSADAKIAGVSIQRYKGLGEMNPEQLWETTMNPANRILLRVDIENAREADKIFDILMGDEVLPRKKFIQAHAKNVKNLDI